MSWLSPPHLYSPSSVTLLLGTGHGGFRSGATFMINPGSQDFVVGDFNGDSKPDLAIANGDHYFNPQPVSFLTNTTP